MYVINETEMIWISGKTTKRLQEFAENIWSADEMKECNDVPTLLDLSGYN